MSVVFKVGDFPDEYSFIFVNCIFNMLFCTNRLSADLTEYKKINSSVKGIVQLFTSFYQDQYQDQ